MIEREAAELLTVGEVMLGRPKTLAADATVAELRQLFENGSVRTALLVDGPRFVGAVERDDLPAGAADGQPARAFAHDDDGERARPDQRVRDVIAKVDSSREGRLVVVDENGSLQGLLCLSGIEGAFCSGNG